MSTVSLPSTRRSFLTLTAATLLAASAAGTLSLLHTFEHILNG